MSVLDIPLRKVLQLFYAPSKLRRAILRDDLRLDQRKEQGGNRGQGGDFYAPFWADVKKHVAGEADLAELTIERVNSSKRRARLYPALKDGVIDLLSEKLRWANEPLNIVPVSVAGNLVLEEFGAVVRVRGAIHAQVRDRFIRVVYPYFSEDPVLPEEGGRLGLWVMQKSLAEVDPADVRIIDILRRSFFSPALNPLNGGEEDIFKQKYVELLQEQESIRRDIEKGS